MSKDDDGSAVVADARGLAIGHAKRWTRAIEERFLQELAASANVAHSLRTVGMTTASAYKRRRNSPAFSVAWRTALDLGYAELEGLLLRQALNGVEQTETVTDTTGAVKQIKTVHSFPHRLAISLLQAHREEVQRYRSFETARDDHGPAAVAAIRAAMDRVRARLTDDGAET